MADLKNKLITLEDLKAGIDTISIDSIPPEDIDAMFDGIYSNPGSMSNQPRLFGDQSLFKFITDKKYVKKPEHVYIKGYVRSSTSTYTLYNYFLTNDINKTPKELEGTENTFIQIFPDDYTDLGQRLKNSYPYLYIDDYVYIPQGVSLDGLMDGKNYIVGDPIAEKAVARFANLDTSQVNSMKNMFRSILNMYNYDFLRNWNTSNVEDMSQMFYGTSASAINYTTHIFLDKWDVSKVKDMSAMFYYLGARAQSGFQTLESMADWDVSNVTNMNNMFACSYIESFEAIDNWDVSNVTSHTYMFYQCKTKRLPKWAQQWSDIGATITP